MRTGGMALAFVAIAAPACFADLGGFTGGAGDAGPSIEAGSDATPDDAGDATAPPPPSDAADADAGSSVFTDDFARADGMTIGNGWVMKYAPAFRLLGGAAQRLFPDSAHDFDNNIVYRPTSEKLLDVEIAATVKLTGAPGYPQIHARVQDSVTTPSELDSYILFADASSTMILARQHGSSTGYVSLAQFDVAPAFDTSSSYRFTLRVTGTSPVALAGKVERMTAPMTGWQLVGQGSTTD
ncbi:MAG TPA: hypothetical protein VIF62_21125, partial [Labilithrix sp.]